MRSRPSSGDRHRRREAFCLFDLRPRGAAKAGQSADLVDDLGSQLEQAKAALDLVTAELRREEEKFERDMASDTGRTPSAPSADPQPSA
jgi:hypothetical protein